MLADRDARDRTRYRVEVALPVPLDQTFSYLLEPDARPDGRTPAAGDLVGAPFGRRREVVGLVTAVAKAGAAETTADGRPLRPVGRLLPVEYALAEDRLRLARWLAAYYALPLGEVVPLFHPPAPGTRARGGGAASEPYPLAEEPPARLTPAQREAAAAALRHVRERRYGAILVHGITGSGKTEVFLRVIAEALARDRGAIYLLPEIALTPQTLARIVHRFGPRAAALHSGLSAGERCRVHEAAARGEVRVVVGPRSALFAPVRDLGVVIVDEEHETSYKQEEKPRYHARHAALVRAREAGAVVLLGSATPDLESYRNARRGRYRLFVLRERPVGVVPTVEVVDLRGQTAPEGFGATLLERIETTLAGGEQVILFYNRRGFARVLQCAACGEAIQCPRCDIGLTFHLRPRRLLCHYCGHTAAVPAACPHCGGSEFLPGGAGTEKLEIALQAAFPGVAVGRLDQDATRRRGSHGRILGDFAAGRTRILLGTQMVAKGHHFPEVGLVGVLAADDGLSLPDFRAGERVFQLLTQVAGRTGRIRSGRVVFQTYRPEDPVIRAAAAQDYEAFVAGELAARRAFGYPPYRRLLRVAMAGRRLGPVERAAGTLAGLLAGGLSAPGREVLGPAPAVFPRLQDRYRYQLLVKGTLSLAQKGWLADCARRLRERERGVEVTLDVDPLGVY